jgi:hypothetical protein
MSHLTSREDEKRIRRNKMLPSRNITFYIWRRPVITTQENIALVQHGPEKNGMRPLPTYGICPPDEAAQIFPL